MQVYTRVKKKNNVRKLVLEDGKNWDIKTIFSILLSEKKNNKI